MRLEQRLRAVEQKTAPTSRNSSSPPSADAPKTRQQRRAQAREKAKELAREDAKQRKAGGQPGHPGAGRALLSEDQMSEIVHHYPEECSGCGREFTDGEKVPRHGPGRHQVAEMPPTTVVYVEHRTHRLRCPGCAKRTRAVLGMIGESAFGPGLQHRRLTGTARELNAIQNCVADQPTVLVREQATEAAVMRQLPRHRRAHIACHSLVDPDDARYSGLILAMPDDNDDGHERHDDLLQAWEIAELELPCQAVVLSSCSAAAGDIVRSEGLVGLVHALQLSGVRQVLAPLWPIADQVAPDILANLYKHLEDGCSLDEGMRRTRQDFRHANPAHWACWSVYGSGGGSGTSLTPGLPLAPDAL